MKMSENCSSESDMDCPDDEYDFTCDDAKSILREWIANQSAEVSHIQGILLVEVLMYECGMSKHRHQKWQLAIPPHQSDPSGDGILTSTSVVEDIVPEERGTCTHNILINDEKVCSKATKWLREETAKRNSTLTLSKFKAWVNNHLLPSVQSQQQSALKSSGSVTT